jgi:hypothetical protein
MYDYHGYVAMSSEHHHDDMIVACSRYDIAEK